VDVILTIPRSEGLGVYAEVVTSARARRTSIVMCKYMFTHMTFFFFYNTGVHVSLQK